METAQLKALLAAIILSGLVEPASKASIKTAVQAANKILEVVEKGE
jgi:hypothetical protein